MYGHELEPLSPDLPVNIVRFYQSDRVCHARLSDQGHTDIVIKVSPEDTDYNPFTNFLKSQSYFELRRLNRIPAMAFYDKPPFLSDNGIDLSRFRLLIEYEDLPLVTSIDILNLSPEQKRKLLLDTLQIFEDFYLNDAIHHDFHGNNVLVQDLESNPHLIAIDCDDIRLLSDAPSYTREDRSLIRDICYFISDVFSKKRGLSWLISIEEVEDYEQWETVKRYIDEEDLGPLIDETSLYNSEDKMRELSLQLVNLPKELANYLYHTMLEPGDMKFTVFINSIRDWLENNDL